jgi:GNAT superfamily N-acetyltransferase
MVEIVIRAAQTGDAAALARIHIDSWRAAYKGLVPDSHLQGLSYDKREAGFRKAIADSGGSTFVAETGERIAGLMTIGPSRDADLDSTAVAEIWGIYLAPEFWRQGIGRRLVEEAEMMFVAKRYAGAILWVFEGNPQARWFYEAMGFAPDGKSRMLNPGTPLKAIRYRKRL